MKGQNGGKDGRTKERIRMRDRKKGLTERRTGRWNEKREVNEGRLGKTSRLVS